MTPHVPSDETSEYLAQLAHEMRTPLHSMLGFAHMLSQECQQPQHQEWLNNLRASGKHLLDLINDVIDFHRLHTQQVEIANEGVDLPQLFDDILQGFAPQAKQGKISLQATMVDDSPRYWRADRRKIKQILINLISNAIKFTPPQGEVHILASQVGNNLHLVVEDTGIGMDTETLENLFQPYYHSKSRLNQQGTGLGLTITRRLVHLMQGEILVDSRPNEGTRIIILLPLQPDTAPQAPADTPPAPLQLNSPITLLLIDDDPLHHQVLAGMIKHHPITMPSAHSVQEALDNCQTYHPDLVLTDFRLPDGSGLELAGKLKRCLKKRENQDKTPKIALLTAYRGAEIQNALHTHQVDAILYKPLEMNDLLALAQQCVPPTAASETPGSLPQQRAQDSMDAHLRALWPEFYQQLGEGLQECRQLAQQGKHQQLCALAHRLKGQCMIFHHHHLWQQFEALEDLADSGNAALIDGILTQIQHTYEQERPRQP